MNLPRPIALKRMLHGGSCRPDQSCWGRKGQEMQNYKGSHRASSSRSWQPCAVRMSWQWQLEERHQILQSLEDEQRDCEIKKMPEEGSGKSPLPAALSCKQTHSGRCSLDDVMIVVLFHLNTIWVTHSRIECWLKLGRININTGSLWEEGEVLTCRTKEEGIQRLWGH